MPIPVLIRSRIKDLLRVPASVSTYDAVITQHYETELKGLLLQTDFLVEQQPIPTVVDKSIYPLSTRTLRVLALFHNALALARVPSRTHDLLTEWETEPSGTPEEFTLDHLPLGVDNLAAPLTEQVLVRPAPDASAGGSAGLVAWAVATPVDLSAPLPVPYLIPYLAYRTASRVLAQDLDIRDLPASQFWGQLAELWRAAIAQTVKL
jgi:hypothetical protein